MKQSLIAFICVGLLLAMLGFGLWLLIPFGDTISERSFFNKIVSIIYRTAQHIGSRANIINNRLNNRPAPSTDC